MPSNHRPHYCLYSLKRTKRFFFADNAIFRHEDSKDLFDFSEEKVIEIIDNRA